MDFKYYVIEQLRIHPAIQPQDIVKLCYQAAFGAEHLLLNKEAARNYFEQEYKTVEVSDHLPLYENISEEVCRVNLAAWKAKGLSKETLFEMFAASAGFSAGSEALFSEYIETAENLIREGITSFSFSDWSAFWEDYRKGGIRAVHHSEQYRAAEHPAYRIVNKTYFNKDFS